MGERSIMGAASGATKRAGQQTVADQSFMPVPLETLQLNSIVNFDLYLNVDNKYIFYRKKQLPFSEKHKDNLLANRNNTIYVHFDQKDAYFDYVERHIDTIVANENLSVKERGSLLYGSASKIIKDFLDKPDSSNVLRRSENFIQNKVNFILKDEKSFHSVVQLMSHDYHTYTHSINVCTFCLGLASRSLGIKDAETLKQIGTGAMLHDLGKSRIDKSVLTRPGPLTQEEWTLMKQHPQWGLDIVQSQGEVSDIIKSIILSHHEKCDGSGYPAGLIDAEIPLFAKIGFIIDVYDALTTKRSYKNRLRPFEALAVMRDEMKNGLDKELFTEFIMLLKG